jgi:hypothetical protein
MQIINRTKYPTNELRKIAEYARPSPTLSRYLEITFVYGSGESVYGHIQTGTVNGKVVIQINLPTKANQSYPAFYNESKNEGYLSTNFATMREEIVHTLAHEFRHAEQMYISQRGGHYGAVETSYGSRNVAMGQKSKTPQSRAIERDADIHANYNWGAYRSMSRPSGYADNFFGKWFSNKGGKRR